MAIVEHLNILQQGTDAWNEWRRTNPHIKPDLSTARLRGRHFEGYDFSDTDLSGVDLSEARLVRTKFAKANLSNSNLTEANLREAKMNDVDFESANLMFADLSWADLSGAKLSWAELFGSKFSNTKLTNTNFEKANITHTSFLAVNLGVARRIQSVRISASESKIGRSKEKFLIWFGQANNTGSGSWEHSPHRIRTETAREDARPTYKIKKAPSEAASADVRKDRS
jgi:Pentapeptide repeats (8 copies)